jgi:hypothetical protein
MLRARSNNFDLGMFVRVVHSNLTAIVRVWHRVLQILVAAPGAIGGSSWRGRRCGGDRVRGGKVWRATVRVRWPGFTPKYERYNGGGTQAQKGPMTEEHKAERAGYEKTIAKDSWRSPSQTHRDYLNQLVTWDTPPARSRTLSSTARRQPRTTRPHKHTCRAETPPGKAPRPLTTQRPGTFQKSGGPPPRANHSSHSPAADRHSRPSPGDRVPRCTTANCQQCPPSNLG